MKYLLDTHLVLWYLISKDRLSSECLAILNETHNDFVFSVVSIWEVVIKRALKRTDFTIDPQHLRRDLINIGFHELEVNAFHVLEVQHLPAFHRDPFDRLLVAQALNEKMTFLTADKFLAQYSDGIKIV